MRKFVFSLLSLFLVIFSFSQVIYEYQNRAKVLPWKEMVIDHNYIFDYNFYLSRLREGQPARNASRSEAGGEGRWTVVEKYTSEPHQGSLLQIFYLLAGKIGGVFHLSPPVIYHGLRLLLGFLLLYTIYLLIEDLFGRRGFWAVLLAYSLVVTASSWPYLILWVRGFPRFGNYMGWWSVIDAYQRLTFLPHILFGQLGIVFFLRQMGKEKRNNLKRWLIWGIGGFVLGIVFPPAVITLDAIFLFWSILEWFYHGRLNLREWIVTKLSPRVIFLLFSFPSLVYLLLITKFYPWKKLAEFDILHPLPFNFLEYLKALGPTLVLGITGLILVLVRKDKKFLSNAAWLLGLGFLFKLFSYIPSQSPLRFTESVPNIPLGILSAYFILSTLDFINKSLRPDLFRRILISGVCLLGLFPIFMGGDFLISSRLWLLEQSDALIQADYPPVPDGVYLSYPTKDFMNAVRYLRDHTDHRQAVLSYIASGNFIPAYAGNTVFMGHANTPFLERKIEEAQLFFSSKMGERTKRWLKDNNIFYVFYGPAERDLGKAEDISVFYPFLKQIYSNQTVRIYRIIL